MGVLTCLVVWPISLMDEAKVESKLAPWVGVSFYLPSCSNAIVLVDVIALLVKKTFDLILN